MTTDWVIAAAGDAIIGTGIAVHDGPHDPGFHEMCNLIRSADLASVNLETSMFNLDTFTGWPAAERGGSYLLGDPDLIGDLRTAGFDLFARANNHAGDWGIEGMLATSRELDQRAIHHAGVGMNLAEAARPTYYDTPKGRVAMLSLTTTFPVSSKAAPQRHDIQGRPGCNGVGVVRSLALPPGPSDIVRQALREYGNPRLMSKSRLALVEGDSATVEETLDQRDVDRILCEIEKAAAFSDLVLVNGHTHEPDNSVEYAPAWLESFARQCIDAGANAYLGHGPHRLRAVEIYKDRPIFYSLGNFVFHREVADPIPAEQYATFGLDPVAAMPHEYVRARDESGSELSMTESVYYESVIPMLTFDDGALVSMSIHPIELSHDRPVGAKGTPRLATGQLGDSILERLNTLSTRHGLELSQDKGVAHWLRNR